MRVLKNRRIHFNVMRSTLQQKLKLFAVGNHQFDWLHVHFFLAKRLVKSYKWIMECLNVLMVSVFGVIEWQILHTAIEHIFVHFGMCEWFEVGINHREKKNNHLWPSVALRFNLSYRWFIDWNFCFRVLEFCLSIRIINVEH